MLGYKDKEILYLAPNDEILNQIKKYIVHFIHGQKGSLGTKNTEKIIKKIFSNLKLATYSSLSNSNEVKRRKIDDSTVFSRWSHNKEEIIKRFDEDSKYQAKEYDVARIYFENYKMTNGKKYVDSEEKINTLNKK